jgi:subtilisin family serine protease
VEFIEQDATVSLNESLISPPLQQPNATWGLDRIDQTSLPLDAAYNYQYTGAGVYAFIIDTGIWPSHTEFTGRVSLGFTAITDGRGSADCNGHGTHVAGTVGGRTWGVAKGVSLVPVRVLDCAGSGTNSGVIAGVDWVAGQTALRPAVANMSLGGGLSSALNASVAAAVAKGVTMVVAAGNSNANACNSSPASEPTAITVGATTSTDARAGYSNYGSCLDIFAPGSGITSAWYNADNAINTISGTSMASPHVAGAAVLALAANGQVTPAQVTDFLIAQASTGKVSSAGTGSPNLLLFALGSGAPTTPVVKTVAVSALSARGAKSGSNWRATATVTIRQFDGSNFVGAVSGATVSGTFNPGGVATCITASTGSCTLSSSTLSRSLTNSSFAVTNVTGASLSYDPTKNAATSVSITRP